jgi:hypothetical protein
LEKSPECQAFFCFTVVRWSDPRLRQPVAPLHFRASQSQCTAALDSPVCKTHVSTICPMLVMRAVFLWMNDSFWSTQH